ncbi:hypothetical protein QZH41_013644 [Actinostola sp. cb2023]|nr:hypothetical protein QZH41_013644 [Actinostola sp. cb2023]
MAATDQHDAQNVKEENQELKKKVSELTSQLEDLKSEVKCLNKKFKKTEYERENAEGHVKNLKRDLDSVRKEFYDEKKKWKQEREALAKACKEDIKTVLEEAAEQAMNEDSSSTGEITSSDDDDGTDDDDDDDMHHSIAPCIRAIVTESDKLKIGTLFVVTCTGGTLGREKDVGHTIRIPDVAVSKYHCKFAYDQERRQYFITDLASRNGSFLNGKQFGQKEKESESQVLTHGDSISVGGTTLEIHIHQGHETCDGCEPGLLQARVASTEDQGILFCTTSVITQRSCEDQRKKLLKNLKKAYGLQQEDYTQGSDTLDVRKYRDRADLRRVKVGSDVPNQPDAAPASVHRPIGYDNKGRKMMENMGWKDGEGLGKESSGLKEPVVATIHEKSRGLGSGVTRSIDAVNQRSSSKVLSKTRERYEQLVNANQVGASHKPTIFVPQMNKEGENEVTEVENEII